MREEYKYKYLKTKCTDLKDSTPWSQSVRQIFGLKRNELLWQFMMLHDKELCDLHRSLVRVMNLGGYDWLGV
jgi:hypothetical protein